MQRITLAFEVPAAAGPVLVARARLLANRLEGSIPEAANAVTFSRELRELGLELELNVLLVAAGIETIDQLCGHTEESLRATDLRHAELREVMRKLAAQDKVLAGCQVAPDDLIELLDLSELFYCGLKKSGYHALSQLTVFEPVAMIATIGSMAVYVIAALKQLNRPSTPLNLDRPLTDLRPPSPTTWDVLTAAGIDIAGRIGNLTATGLLAALQTHPDLDDTAAREGVDALRQTLDLYGYHLPN
ncbi:MAG TPA: hypothetical protein VMT30_04610 [Candidatus Saccharimonadia bacterium]|nr:hypothetical protein [Candidatus Saccharimonadia bacterium]